MTMKSQFGESHFGDPQLGDALAGHAQSFDLGGLADITSIAQGAQRRTRRNRALAGAGALVLVVALALGLGNFRSTEESGLQVVDDVTTTELAYIAEQDLRPALNYTLAARGQFVGIAPVRLRESVGEPAALAAVVSSDGLNWELAGDGKAWRGDVGIRFDMFESQGTFHVITVNGSELIHATSTDFVEWDEISQPLPAELPQPHSDLILLTSGTTDTGLYAHFLQAPGLGTQVQDRLAELTATGVSEKDLCEITRGDGVMTYRVCGTTELSQFTFDGGSIDMGDLVNHFIASEVDGPFRYVDNVEPKSSDSVRMEVDYNDGQAIVRHDGDTVERLELSSIYPGLDTENFTIGTFDFFENKSIVKGVAGWAVPIHRWNTLSPEPAVTDFSVTQNGVTLEGTVPYGPGTLRTSAGDVLRAWTQLEVANLEWSGIDVSPDGVTVLDERGGEPLATFSHEAWADALAPSHIDVASDLLFSPDGRSWTFIASANAALTVLAVGDDEVIVRSAVAGNGYGNSTAQDLVTPTTVDQRIPIIDGPAMKTMPTEAEPASEGSGLTSGSSAVTFGSSASTSTTESVTTAEEVTMEEVMGLVPSGLPGADEVEQVINATAGSGSGRAALELLRKSVSDEFDQGTGSIIGASVIHRASVAVEEGQLGFFSYNEVNDDPAFDNPLPCIRYVPLFMNGGGSTTCGATGPGHPHAGRDRLSEFTWAVVVEDAPPEAAWVVVQLGDASTIAANLVDGFGAVTWPRELGGEVGWVAIQDANFTEIWARDLSDLYG